MSSSANQVKVRRENTPSTSRSTKVSLDQLFFDPENPRLPSDKRSGDERTIIKWMLKHGDILELMSSIAATGYSDAEPLLVTKNIKGYIVVEGNRRLAAVKLLVDPSLAMLRPKAVAEIASNAIHNDFSLIPVIIYKSRNDILDYLGYRHITGTKPWGPREKAEYLKQIYVSHKADDTPDRKTLMVISQMIGTKPFYAKRLLETLAVVEHAEENAFWESELLDERIDSNFSVFHTALSYENIRSYIGIPETSEYEVTSLNETHIKNILEWVCGKNKLISESRELKRLNAVVGTTAALAMLEKGFSLEIAAEYSGEALEDLRNFMNQAYNKLREVDRFISRVATFSEDDLNTAKDVANLARKIYRSIADASDSSDF